VVDGDLPARSLARGARLKDPPSRAADWTLSGGLKACAARPAPGSPALCKEVRVSVASMVGAIAIAAGVALGGWFVGDGFREGRAHDRYVSVKGVAEREATADVALWPLRFVATDDDLAVALGNIKTSAEAVYAFLGRHGIRAEQAELRELEVTDVLANQYGNRDGGSRYIISQTIMVRSGEPDVVFAASQKWASWWARASCCRRAATSEAPARRSCSRG
jgi:hypothetical protein